MKTDLTPFVTPGDALAFQADKRETQECMVFGDHRMTFGEWRHRSVALARGLMSVGLGRGDHIGLLAESRLEWPSR